MANTANLSLPLVAPSQAQKHITVNEALSLLDAFAQFVLQSRTLATPPISGVDGQAFVVPTGASGDWAGRDGEIAIWSNGGWAFVAPQVGWRAWLQDEAHLVFFDGSDWLDGAAAATTNGAATGFRVLEVDHVISAGTTNTVAGLIPAGSYVLAVTGRVTSTIGGGLSAWELGVSGSSNRYGQGLGLGTGSWVRGLTGQPQAYWSDQDLLLTATGGDFAGGTIRLAAHVVTFGIPRV